MSWLGEVEAGLGRRAAWAAAAAVVAGVAAFATGLGAGGAPRTFGVLIAGWLFFAGAAMGAVAFRAFFQIVDASWAGPLAAQGGRLAAFGPVAAILLVVLLAGAGAAPWLAHREGLLGGAGLAGRQLLGAALLFGLAWFGFRGGPAERRPPSRALAVVFCLVYAVVLSAWAFDFVLGPDPAAESTLVGPYLFMSAFAAGTGLVTLLGLWRGDLGERERRDAASLVFALSVFWAYLFCSQYLTSWYGNLPEETGYLLRRGVDGWSAVTLAVIGLVFAVPFLGLLHPAGRRSSRIFGAVLLAQLTGLWLDCHLLVVPSLAPRGSAPLGLRDLLVVAGLLGALALSVAPSLQRQPAP